MGGTGQGGPYEAAGFYDDAIAAGRHRAVVGGRWDETGRAQMAALLRAGLQPHHHLLDIGAGALRLGCKAVPYLHPGHYWATDASRALMLAGHSAELDAPARLPMDRLVQDAGFAFPGVPDTITHAIAFAVFPHLPPDAPGRALAALRRFPRLGTVLFTVFLAPDDAARNAWRQRDGVVTHPDRAPWHLTLDALHDMAAREGWTLMRDDAVLPRGQALFLARPDPVDGGRAVG